MVNIYNTYYGELDGDDPSDNYLCEVIIKPNKPKDSPALIALFYTNVPFLMFATLCEDGKYRNIHNIDDNGIFISDEQLSGITKLFNGD